MARSLIAIFLGCFLLLTGCGESSSEVSDVPTVQFQRRGFQNRNFHGHIGMQPVVANLSLRKDNLSGELTFEQSSLKRRIDARMSFEGLIRGNAVSDQQDSIAGLGASGPAEIKAVMLTAGGIVGTYQNSLSPAPENLVLTTKTDSLVAVASLSSADSLTWGYWFRHLTCVKGAADTTATIAFRIPNLTGPQSEENLLTIYVQAVFAIAYQQKCTCQSLEGKGIAHLRVDFSAVNSKGNSLVVVEGYSDDVPYFEQSLQFDLHTGTVSIPSISPALPHP